MSTKLSKKLERINTSVSKIRQKANMPDAVIEDLVVAVESMVTPEGSITITENSTVDVSNYAEAIVNVAGGGSASGIHRVTSITERDALQAEEGDLCVVYGEKTTPLSLGPIGPCTMIFNDTAVSPTPVTTSGYVSYSDANYDVDMHIEVSNTRIRFNYTDYSSGYNRKSVSYTSTDGINYTKTTTTVSQIDIPKEITPRGSQWFPVIGEAAGIPGLDFGLYTYENNSWVNTDIGISVNPSKVYKDQRVFGNEGEVLGTLGSESAVVTDTINILTSINDSLNKIKFTGLFTDVFDSVFYSNYEYNPTEDFNKIYLPEIDCSGITQMVPTGSIGRYNFTGESVSQPYYKYGIMNCAGFKNLGAGFADSTYQGVNFIHLAFTHFMDESSLVALFKGLAPVTAAKDAGICIDARILKVIKDNDLFDEIRSKGWKIAPPKGQSYNEITSLVPTTASQGQSFMNSHKGSLVGTLFDESILTSTLTFTDSSIGSECSLDPLNEYYPILKFTLNNSAPYPSYTASGCFRKCYSLKRIGGISFTSNHSSSDYKYITDIGSMYQDCHNLEVIPAFDCSRVTSAGGTFKNCFKLTSAPSYDLTKVTWAESLFQGCKSLVDISNLNLPVAYAVGTIFKDCVSLVNIPSTFKLPKVKQLGNAIYNCPNLSPASIFNFFNGITMTEVLDSHKDLSKSGLTKEQWNSLSSSQQTTILNKGFRNDFA